MKFSEKFTNDQIKAVASAIEDFTDKNDHGSAAKALATFLKNKKAEKAIEGINTLHTYFGHMPQELGKVRSQIVDELLKELKSKVSDSDYKTIYKGF
jgi:ribosomal protein L10